MASNVLIEGMNQEFIGKVVRFFCDALGIGVPILHIFVDDTISVAGACYQNDHDDYLIALRQQDTGQMIVTLAHELVHVKQYVLDGLADKWDTAIPYRERWWEVEAYEKEVELTKLLVEAVTAGEI
jgi:hypothetical protein